MTCYVPITSVKVCSGVYRSLSFIPFRPFSSYLVLSNKEYIRELTAGQTLGHEAENPMGIIKYSRYAKKPMTLQKQRRMMNHTSPSRNWALDICMDPVALHTFAKITNLLRTWGFPKCSSLSFSRSLTIVYPNLLGHFWAAHRFSRIFGFSHCQFNSSGIATDQSTWRIPTIFLETIYTK